MARGKPKKGKPTSYVQMCGENRYNAKLTRDRVKRIRTTSTPATVLARLYGCSAALIRMVRQGRAWAWLQ
jgi:hypothetical protein